MMKWLFGQITSNEPKLKIFCYFLTTRIRNGKKTRQRFPEKKRNPFTLCARLPIIESSLSFRISLEITLHFIWVSKQNYNFLISFLYCFALV